MITIENEIVEKEIIKIVDGLCKKLLITTELNSDSCPGIIGGISSQVLISTMGKLEAVLNIVIPDNIYIFHDKKSGKQLSIKDAATKLIKTAKYGK